MSRFEFPQVCCRCAAPEPTRSFPVQSSDHKSGSTNSLVSITYTVAVPVCSACRRSLQFLSAICWFSALTVGGTSGCLIYDWASRRPNAETIPEYLTIGMPILMGGIIAASVAWLLKGIFINYDFAYFDPNEQTMVFKNKDTQQLFDELNTPVAQRRYAG